MDTAAPSSHTPEQVHWSGRVSHWYFLGQWLVGIVVAGALGTLLYLFRNNLPPALLPWIFTLPLLLLLLVIVAIAWQRAKRRYWVTNHRVIMEYGRWVKDTQEIRIQDIRSMNVSKEGFAGLLGIGKVEFSSAATDEADVIFYHISGTDRVRDLVRKLQS